MQLLEIIGLLFCQANNNQTIIVYLTSDSSERLLSVGEVMGSIFGPNRVKLKTLKVVPTMQVICVTLMV